MTPTWVSPCGRAVLYLGDCLQVLPTLEAGSVDAVVTDPPYEITASGGGIVTTRRVYQDTEGFTDSGFDYRVLDGFDNWACFGTLRQVPRLIESACDRRWMLITWNKPNPCPLVSGNYLPDTEYIVHAWRKGGLHGGYREKSRFIVHPHGNPDHGAHPNEKPVAVMLKVVGSASGSGQTILDPFMGSGTTGVAAIRLGRRFIGVELDPGYFEIAKRRIIEALDSDALFRQVEQPQPEPQLFGGDA